MKPPKNPPEPRYVTVACEHCEGGIEFDAHQLEGDKTRIVECPHCHLETTVFDPEPETPIVSPEPPANESLDGVVLALPPLNLTPPEKLYANRVHVADIEELSAITRHFADELGLEIDARAIERIARSADGAPLEVLNRLRCVQNYARAKGNDKKITVEIAEEVLKTLSKPGKTSETNASANNKAVEIQPGRKEIPPHEAFDRLLKAAAQGQARAEYSLGLAYFKGLGVSENHAEAVKWWHKAAEQGHVKRSYAMSQVELRMLELHLTIRSYRSQI